MMNIMVKVTEPKEYMIHSIYIHILVCVCVYVYPTSWSWEESDTYPIGSRVQLV